MPLFRSMWLYVFKSLSPKCTLYASEEYRLRSEAVRRMLRLKECTVEQKGVEGMMPSEININSCGAVRLCTGSCCRCPPEIFTGHLKQEGPARLLRYAMFLRGDLVS